MYVIIVVCEKNSYEKLCMSTRVKDINCEMEEWETQNSCIQFGYAEEKTRNYLIWNYYDGHIEGLVIKPHIGWEDREACER